MKLNRKQINALKEVINIYGHYSFSGDGCFLSNHSDGEGQYGF
ncbi:MAG: hypothetical protein WD361_14895 [Gracilimonas sp.]